MTEERPSTLIKLSGLFSRKSMHNRCFISLKSYKTSILIQILNICNLMTMNVQWMSLATEQLHFLDGSLQGVLYDVHKAVAREVKEGKCKV